MRWIHIDFRTFYCPTDATSFYVINYNYITDYDELQYCPQDTTGFYDFAQQP